MNRIRQIHKMILPAAWILLQLICWADVVPAAQGPARIVIQEFSEIEGREIGLGDIARIRAKSHIAEILRGISLGRAPKPGEIKHLSKSRVLSQLRTNQSLPKGIEILSPEKIYVKRAYQEISGAEIRARVEDLLADRFEGREFRLKRLDIQETGYYPKGEIELRSSPAQAVDKKGNVNLSFDVLVNQEHEDTVRVRGAVAVYEPVACAARALGKGSVVGEGDVVLVKKDIFLLRGEVITSLDSLDGQRLKRGISRDTPIRADWLEPLPLIRKGEVVALVARAKHLKIVTSGIAKEDGFKDRVVRVENLSSGKLVRGLAKEDSTVEVIY